MANYDAVALRGEIRSHLKETQMASLAEALFGQFEDVDFATAGWTNCAGIGATGHFSRDATTHRVTGTLRFLLGRVGRQSLWPFLCLMFWRSVVCRARIGRWKSGLKTGLQSRLLQIRKRCAEIQM